MDCPVFQGVGTELTPFEILGQLCNFLHSSLGWQGISQLALGIYLVGLSKLDEKILLRLVLKG